MGRQASRGSPTCRQGAGRDRLKQATNRALAAAATQSFMNNRVTRQPKSHSYWIRRLPVTTWLCLQLLSPQHSIPSHASSPPPHLQDEPLLRSDGVLVGEGEVGVRHAHLHLPERGVHLWGAVAEVVLRSKLGWRRLHGVCQRPTTADWGSVQSPNARKCPEAEGRRKRAPTGGAWPWAAPPPSYTRPRTSCTSQSATYLLSSYSHA